MEGKALKLGNEFVLEGVFPPLTTPFEGGEVALDFLRRNVESYNAVELGGYVVLGSTGEFPHLSLREKVAAVEAVVETAAEGRVVIAGTGELSTQATIDLTRAVAEAGAQAAMVVPPFYFRPHMDDAALERHYEAVAEASPIPVILYNMPAYAGVELSPSLVERLSWHPNIIGIKDSSGRLGLIDEYIRLTSPNFRVFAGSASVFLAAMIAGAVGAIIAAADFAPWECAELYRAFREGDYDLARQRQAQLGAAERVVAGRYGVAGVKAAMDMFGYFGLDPRPPLIPLDEDARGIIRQTLIDAGLLRGA